MKKLLALFMVFLLTLGSVASLAEMQTATATALNAASSNPPAMPDGQEPGGAAPGGAPGGQSSQPDSYTVVNTYTEDTTLTDGTYASTDTDENAIVVGAGTTTIDNATITRTSADSFGGDSASFYGVGAALLVTVGTVKLANSIITTDAAGGAGVFAYGDGVAYVSNTTITTTQDTAGGIHVAGGGTLYAKDLMVTTSGGSAAAIRSDRGSSTMMVDGVPIPPTAPARLHATVRRILR